MWQKCWRKLQMHICEKYNFSITQASDLNPVIDVSRWPLATLERGFRICTCNILYTIPNRRWKQFVYGKCHIRNHYIYHIVALYMFHIEPNSFVALNLPDVRNQINRDRWIPCPSISQHWERENPYFCMQQFTGYIEHQVACVDT